MHRILPESFRSGYVPDRPRSTAELSAKLRKIREQGLIPLGPAEPLGGATRNLRSEQERLHLWVIGAPDLDYRVLRLALGKHQIPVRFHVIEHAGHTLNYLSERERPPIHALVVGRCSEKQEPRHLLMALRKRREFRKIPAFVCDRTFCSDRSRELYAAGTNGYLCGGAASRQLAAALLRNSERACKARPTGT